MLRRIWRAIADATRRYFVAGLLAFAPIGITVWAIAWIVRKLDALLLPPLLKFLFPSVQTAPNLPPFVGVAFVFLVILLSGVIVRHLFGHEIVRLWERLLSRVPVARGLYGGVKQLFQAILNNSNASASFNRVVMVEYPRTGVYALAFTTGSTRGPILDTLPHERLVNCFLPTTPNPTSGFYLVLPESELYVVAMSVEDAFKVIMSAGLVSPDAIASVKSDATTDESGEPTSTASAKVEEA
jgi:uncharacterized membrane protein